MYKLLRYDYKLLSREKYSSTMHDVYKLLRYEYKLLHEYYKLLHKVYKLLCEDFKLLREGKVYQLINWIDCMTFRKCLLTSVTKPKKLNNNNNT